ncbi:hypothetical protein G7046_g7565 [Stylonectria norvegica]|nr:hypothetical protein G7046_g7565 [Stylonectria norvegica]
MNISDSMLFKNFARPILQHNNHNNSTSNSSNNQPSRSPHSSPGIMDTVIQYLINRSRLEVSRVKISNPTEDSYSISIESRVSNTGPISSTISSMELELVFNGCCFGRMTLPEVKTSFWGTKVVVSDQRINISDMAIYKSFVRSILVSDETSFQLENGACTIKALGITAHCNYCIDIPIKGMRGPQVTLKKLVRNRDTITAVFHISNPSPVEVDHGTCVFELRNDQGETMAELKGELRIVRGEADFTLRGTTPTGVAPSKKARLVGLGVDGNSWCNETVRYIDAVMDVKPEFVKVLRG